MTYPTSAKTALQNPYALDVLQRIDAMLCNEEGGYYAGIDGGLVINHEAVRLLEEARAAFAAAARSIEAFAPTTAEVR